MTIHTQESLSGFIASDPQLSYTAKGDPRLYARIGQEHYRREPDGSFSQTETTYHHLVMFNRSAERAAERFAKGDNFIAEGYTRSISCQRDGQNVEGEEFVAKKIGHDTARTRYEVDRARRSSPTAQAQTPTVSTQHSQSVPAEFTAQTGRTPAAQAIGL